MKNAILMSTSLLRRGRVYADRWIATATLPGGNCDAVPHGLYRYPPLMFHQDMICVTKFSTLHTSRRSYFTSIFEPNSAPSSQDGEQDSNMENDDDDENVDDASVLPQNTVIERPCSLILAEEFVSIPPLGFEVAPPSESASSTPHVPTRKFKSWHRSFSNIFPNQFGIAYTKWSLSDPKEFYNEQRNSAMTEKATFDLALSAMKYDFRAVGSLIQNPILITRGPVLSWMAQFYLESLPLSGLIMIDPIPFENERAYQLYQSHYDAFRADQMNKDGNNSSGRLILSDEYYDIINDFNEHWGHWTLKLEAGAIPMMILSTKIGESQHLENDEYNGSDNDGELQFNNGSTESTDVNNSLLWREFAEQTAQRHSTNPTMATATDSDTGERPSPPSANIPVVDVDPNNIKQCTNVIHDWIIDKVL